MAKEKLPKTGRIIEELKCLACGNEWFPRSPGEIPAICPKCKSASWKTGPRYAKSKDAAPTKVQQTEASELEAAKARGFVFDRSDKVYNSYYRWCEIHQLPFVKVRLKMKYAVVRVDMLTTLCFLNEQGQKKVRELLSPFTTSNPLEGFVGKEICSTDGVPKERAEAIATALFQIVSDFTNQEARYKSMD